jgi:nucleotide-binding universal stress UspA family protein
MTTRWHKEESKMSESLFSKILHATDGSDHAFDAFTLALAIAKQNGAELHIVSVGEIAYIPQFIEDIREQKEMAARHLHTVLQRARAAAAENNLKLHSHVLVGRPVRAIVALARELNVELLVIGARGHSALYERVIGSRANRIMQLAHCSVLTVKSSRRGPRVMEKLSFKDAWDQIVGAGARRFPIRRAAT